jgi:catechol 2,3-dioxygenase
MTLPQPVAIAVNRISPQTRPGYVHLKVASLDRQIDFYQKTLKLHLNWREGPDAGLGVKSQDLVRMTELPNGRRYRGVTGIYHFAILFPDRRELARAIARLFALHWPNSPTDHIMTKTTYLDDPEGNTIELYCESPEDGIFDFDKNGEFFARHADGTPSDGREPLDLEALFSNLNKADRLDQPVPPETRIGHFHLYVSNLEETRRFYHELLGFDDMGVSPTVRMGMVSAGGYHHHIGYNTWQGEAAPPPPPDALGLKQITFTFPDREAWQAFMARLEELQLPYNQTDEGILLSDPSQNGVLFERPE